MWSHLLDPWLLHLCYSYLPSETQSPLKVKPPLLLKLLLWFSGPVVSDSLWPHGIQHTQPLFPSPSPKVCPSSCPLRRWCHPAISFSDTLFSFCPHSFPASETSNESAVCIRWAKYQNFNFSTSPSNKYSLKIDWFDLLAVQGTGVFSSNIVQRHQFFSALPSLQSSSHNPVWPLERPQPWLCGLLSAE